MPEAQFDPFAGGALAVTVAPTEQQTEIWVAAQLGGKQWNLAYNEALIIHLRGKVDAEHLRSSLAELVLRHDALRSTFSEDGEALCVEEEGRAPIEVEHLTHWQSEAVERRLAEVRHYEVTQPFDLTRGPLFRARILVLPNDQCDVILSAHHLVCDGWSAGVLTTELQQLYEAKTKGTEARLLPAAQFADYARDLRSPESVAEAARAESYWAKTLGTRPPTFELPTDRARAMDRDPSAHRLDFTVEVAQVAALKNTAKKLGASLFSLLLAAFDSFLFRLTGQSDLVIAVPSAGQSAAGLPSLVGHCVSTLPLRLTLDPSAPFAEHVSEVQKAVLDGLEHHQLSLGELVKKLEIPRDPSRVPLTPVLFNVDRELSLENFGDAAVHLETIARTSDNFELFVNAAEVRGTIVFEMTYSTALFDASTIARWFAELRTLLGSIVDDPNTPVDALAVLPPEEVEQQLQKWNQTYVELPKNETTLSLFTAQARQTPEAIATRDDKTSLTYQELDRLSSVLAERLRAQGVKPGDLVGVSVSRTARLVAPLLAIWKVGAAYVPLDPDYPAARLNFIGEDAKLRVLVTERQLTRVLSEAKLQRIYLDELSVDEPVSSFPVGGELTPVPAPDDLAYVLHTSGSTGQPKGVQIQHRALLNLLLSMKSWPGMRADDVLVAVTTLSFDIAGLELFLPLISGAQVVVASEEVSRNGSALNSLLKAAGATVLQATPVTWRMLVEAGLSAPRLRALTGGEAITDDLARELTLRVGSLHNVYGPTETTIWSTGADLRAGEPVTIGRPIANTSVYILDKRLQPLPIGAVGELYIGGAGLALGYLNRPDLTAERFIAHPWGEASDRIYKTGDQARFRSDGSISYLGRNDQQIKLRGFRIELGEVEAVLNRHAQVRASAALIRNFGQNPDAPLSPDQRDEDLRLLAFVAAPEHQNDAQLAEELKALLRDHLPHYMIPSHIVVLANLPLTPNGKVDRNALTFELGDGAGQAASEDESAELPRTETEKRLAEIWRSLLRIGRVGVDDGFFDLGGHSMLAIRMMTRVRESFGVELPMRIVFQTQTLAGLALKIDAALIQSFGASDVDSIEEFSEMEF